MDNGFKFSSTKTVGVPNASSREFVCWAYEPTFENRRIKLSMQHETKLSESMSILSDYHLPVRSLVQKLIQHFLLWSSLPILI